MIECIFITNYYVVTKDVHFAFSHFLPFQVGPIVMKAPNGTILKKEDGIALFLAQKVLSLVSKEEAIPYCLTSGHFEHVMMVSVEYEV